VHPGSAAPGPAGFAPGTIGAAAAVLV